MGVSIFFGPPTGRYPQKKLTKGASMKKTTKSTHSMGSPLRGTERSKRVMGCRKEMPRGRPASQQLGVPSCFRRPEMGLSCWVPPKTSKKGGGVPQKKTFTELFSMQTELPDDPAPTLVVDEGTPPKGHSAMTVEGQAKNGLPAPASCRFYSPETHAQLVGPWLRYGDGYY